MKRAISRFLTVAFAYVSAAATSALAQGVITALNPPAQTAGAPSFTLTLTGTNFCYSSSVTFNGTVIPANVAGLSATATITMPEIATPGPVPVTIVGTVGADCTNTGQPSAPFTFTINPPLILAPAGLPGGTVGTPYNQTLTASGGTPPYSTPAIQTGNPPPGITGSAGMMNISFTPAATATYTFGVGVTDSGGGSISPGYSFSVTNPVPANIAPTAGTPQSTAVTTMFPTALQATVTDAFGNFLSGVNVTFAAPGGGASGTFGGPATVTTNRSGVAVAPAFTANGTAGSYTVTATAAGVVMPANFSLTNNPGLPASIAPIAGTTQSATVGMPFATAFQAVVKDANNNVVPGASVTFAAPGGGASGTFSGPATVLTNAAGVATAPTFTANSTVGSYAVTAAVGGLATPANFSLTNNPGPPAGITATSGTPQNTTVNSAFPIALQATVRDASGNLVPNAKVTFAVPGSGASGTFGGSAVVTTNSSGGATAPTLTANSTAGAFTATAAVTGVAGAANFSLTNNPGAPASITATGGTPQSAAVNTAFAATLQATVKDANGNLVPNVPVTFSAPAAGATGSFAAPAIVNTNGSGVAAAPRFTANGALGGYTATASTPGVAATANFSLANIGGAPASIVPTAGTPQSALVGTQYGLPLQVTVKDSGGNFVPNAPVTFTLPAQGPAAVFLAGQSTVVAPTDASGVAASPAFTANANAGQFFGSATVPGIAAPALFALNNTLNITPPAPPPPPLSITTAALPPATVGTHYAFAISASGGVPPYSFSSGSPAPGLSLNTSGTIVGTPTTAGTQTVNVQVTDSVGNTSSKGFTLVVVNMLVVTTSSNLPNGNLGQGYSVTFQATGGQPGYFWSISGGGASPSGDSIRDRLAAAIAGLPPGLSFTSSSSTATLSGTATALGTFSFSVAVTDTAQQVAAKSFSLSVQPSTGPPGLQVSQTALSFQGPQGGNPPPPQYVSVVATNNQPLLATVTLDSGSPGTPVPTWLTARFVSATTPARLAIQTIPTGLPAGPYKGRVLVSYQGQQTIVVDVDFTVDLTPPELAIAPGFLRFAAISGAAGAAQQALLVSNLGTGGPLAFTAKVVSSSPWLTVTPASGATLVGSGFPLQVAVNAQTLEVGAYLGTIRVAGPVGGSVDVPVSLFVSPAGPSITVNPAGVRFDARAGNGLAIPLPVTVLDSGTGMVNWTADLLAGQNWLSLSPAAGQSTPTVSSQLTAIANPAGLQPGPYYGLIRISDPHSLNSPQYALAVLNVAPAGSGPDADLEPGGLFFTATPGGSAPGPQALQVFVSSDTPAQFQAAASSDDGGSWLSIGLPSGTASTHTPGQIVVSVHPAGLKPGVYTGDVSVSFSTQTIRTASITLVVLGAGGTAPSSSESSPGERRRASCAPSQLSLTSTSLVNAFASPAGWPTPLIVRAADDCGDGAAGAQVVATFSNGDPPLNLSRTDSSAALFSGTWAPRNTATQMTVTITGLAPGLASATTRLTGAVGGNTAPALSPNGTLNILNPALGAALAPGTIVQINGSSLAPSASITMTPPLPMQSNGTSVLIGAYLAPLYTLSGGQLDIQIPVELTPDRQYSILVSSGTAFTLPDTLTTTDVSPGLLYVAEHGDLTPISAGFPAQAGETILLYLVGMGAPNPAVPSGTAAPAAPSAAVSNTPLVTFNGQNATVNSAGLTPGLVGLYQIAVQVPSGAPSGDASVTVTQNGTPSNTIAIPIQ